MNIYGGNQTQYTYMYVYVYWVTVENIFLTVGNGKKKSKTPVLEH